MENPGKILLVILQNVSIAQALINNSQLVLFQFTQIFDATMSRKACVIETSFRFFVLLF